MNNKIAQTVIIPGALLLLCLFSYGMHIPGLGFYWDDWPTIWFLHRLGPLGFREVFAVDRPLMSLPFTITTAILGESIVAWQVFGIFARWLSALSLWWTLRLLFPKWQSLAMWSAFLFAIYPGFRQQYVAVTYSHGFIYLSLFFLSLATMILALQKPRWFWLLMAISVILSGLCLFSVEYYAGLELMRVFVLGFIVSQYKLEMRQMLKRILALWAPFLVVFVTFLVWTIFFHDSPRAQIEIFKDLTNKPVAAIFGLLTTIAGDVIESSATAWIRTLVLFNARNLVPLITPAFALTGLSVGGLTFLFFSQIAKKVHRFSNSNKPDPFNSGYYYVIGGLIALLLGGWPIWVTDLEIKLFFPQDRFTLPMMLGACLLMVGLIQLIFNNYSQKALAVAILVGIAAGMHYRDGLSYSEEWQIQKDFFWQLTWRAPHIQPDTILLTPTLPFITYSDNSLTAPLNWTYDPENTSRRMAYLMFDIESRLAGDLKSFEPDEQVYHTYRAAHFSSALSQTLAFYYSPPQCLTAIDPEKELLFPENPFFIPDALALSHPELITMNTKSRAKPPAHIFGPEPEHNWCYYFLSAELALQKGHWEQAAEMADRALEINHDLQPENVSELIPFIEAYAHTAQWNEAVGLSKEYLQISNESKQILCAVWDRLKSQKSVELTHSEFLHISDILKCSGQ